MGLWPILTVAKVTSSKLIASLLEFFERANYLDFVTVHGLATRLICVSCSRTP